MASQLVDAHIVTDSEESSDSTDDDGGHHHRHRHLNPLGTPSTTATTHNLSTAKLKAACRALGEPVGGSRADLLQRLAASSPGHGLPHSPGQVAITVATTTSPPRSSSSTWKRKSKNKPARTPRTPVSERSGLDLAQRATTLQQSFRFEPPPPTSRSHRGRGGGRGGSTTRTTAAAAAAEAAAAVKKGRRGGGIGLAQAASLAALLVKKRKAAAVLGAGTTDPGAGVSTEDVLDDRLLDAVPDSEVPSKSRAQLLKQVRARIKEKKRRGEPLTPAEIIALRPRPTLPPEGGGNKDRGEWQPPPRVADVKPGFWDSNHAKKLYFVSFPARAVLMRDEISVHSFVMTEPYAQHRLFEIIVEVPVLVENRDVFHPTLVQSTEVFLWYKQRRFMYGVMNNTIVPPHASTMIRVVVELLPHMVEDVGIHAILMDACDNRTEGFAAWRAALASAPPAGFDPVTMQPLLNLTNRWQPHSMPRPNVTLSANISMVFDTFTVLQQDDSFPRFPSSSEPAVTFQHDGFRVWCPHYPAVLV